VFTWGISQLVQRKPAGLLDAEIVAKLEPSTQFVIAISNSFEVHAEGGEQFELEIISNSNVGNVEFRQEEKKVPFTVEGETGTRGAAEVSNNTQGNVARRDKMVLIDGEAVAAESNDIIVKSNTETDVLCSRSTTATASTRSKSPARLSATHQSFRCQYF
jgi:hypothetical protein